MDNKKKFDPNNYDDVSSIAEYVRNQVQTTNNFRQPELLIICGSGLNSLAEEIQNAQVLPYNTIPNFPVGNVVGHKGCLVFGELQDRYVMCMQGRVHPYEGWDLATCALPIRVASVLGVKTLLMTSAVGGINKKFKQGDLMCLNDHLFVPGLTLRSPLVGPNDERFGPRFTSSTNLYDLSLRKMAHKVANEQGITLQDGVYAMSGGPHFETPAEIRWLALSGADVVGMSVCHETVIARHCGMRVLALALITNICEDNSDAPQQQGLHEEVLEAGRIAAKHTAQLVKAILKEITST